MNSNTKRDTSTLLTSGIHSCVNEPIPREHKDKNLNRNDDEGRDDSRGFHFFSER